jgi:hypothetical protein
LPPKSRVSRCELGTIVVVLVLVADIVIIDDSVAVIVASAALLLSASPPASAAAGAVGQRALSGRGHTVGEQGVVKPCTPIYTLC